MAEDYKWLVEQRSKTQELILGVYEFGKKHEGELRNNNSLTTIYLLLIGVAFSLWRAVFLIHEKIKKESEDSSGNV